MSDKYWSDHDDPEQMALSAGWRTIVTLLAFLSVASVVGLVTWAINTAIPSVAPATPLCTSMPSPPVQVRSGGFTGATCAPTRR